MKRQWSAEAVTINSGGHVVITPQTPATSGADLALVWLAAVPDLGQTRARPESAAWQVSSVSLQLNASVLDQRLVSVSSSLCKGTFFNYRCCSMNQIAD